MSILRTLVAKTPALAVVVACASASIGAVATSPAVAAPGHHHHYVHCHLHGHHHKHNYPPGHCFLRFDHARYQHGDIAHFTSGSNFKPHEKVRVVERCTKGYVKVHNHRTRHDRHHVGRHGRLGGKFPITHHTPFGRCTVIVTGLTSGDQVKGSFRVVHHR